MKKQSLKELSRTDGRRSRLTNCEHGRCKIKIQDIADALTKAGYHTLDSQADALGLCRSTAWTVVRAKHKLNRLSAKTTRQMLSNSTLPPIVRSVVEQYVIERNGSLSTQTGEERNMSLAETEN